MSDKPAWQYRRRDEGTLHGPYDGEKIVAWFGQPQDAEKAANLEDDTVSALTSHCGSGSFTPPSSDEQAGWSLIPTPRGNESLTLTAPSSPEHRMKKPISEVDAYNVTIGRVPDKLTYRNEGRPNAQHQKNLQKNYVCWMLMPDPAQPDNRAADWAWGPFKLEEVLLAAYQVLHMNTLLAVVDSTVSDYVMSPNTDILKRIAMPIHEHVTAHNQRSPITWSLRHIEDCVGAQAVQHTSTLNAEALDSVQRSYASRASLRRMNSHGLPSDSLDPNCVAWPGAHLEQSALLNMRQRPNSCSQLPPMSVLQHQQARHHGGFPHGMSGNRALDDMMLPTSSASRSARHDPRAPIVHGMDGWQGKKFIVDEATRQRLRHNLIDMINKSQIPPMENKLPPALANPPIQTSSQSMHRQIPSLQMAIPEHSSRMQQMSIPSSGMNIPQRRPTISAPNSYNNDLLSLVNVPARSRHSSRPASYSQVPQEFNIHAADFTPESGSVLSASHMQTNMDSHIHSEMDRIASSFSGQLNMESGGTSTHSSISQGLFQHSDATPMRQTDPGAMHGHMLPPEDAATAASMAAANLGPETVKNILVQMANSMNCPTSHVQQLFHTLTQGTLPPHSNADDRSSAGSGTLPDVTRGMTNQPMVSQPPMVGQPPASGSMEHWPGVNDAGSHLLGSQSLGQSTGQPLHQPQLPPHLQPFGSELPRQLSVPTQSLRGGGDSLSNFGGFGSGSLGGFGGSFNGGSRALGAASAGYGSGNLGSLSDAPGRGHSFGGHSGGFNDNHQYIDLGLGQM